ncbi:MAG TPA: hypothetical protein VNJ52_05055 [Patescibacteria group bacterium]|nr:hypothetical protein [Patescibacteria group bacterium]
MLSQNPQITQRELQMRLEQDGIRLDRKYLGQLLKSVYTERIKRADTWTLNTALAAFQDAMAEIARAGWEIINDPMARNMDKALAMREVREAYSVVFEKLFDAGVFERKRGSIDLMIRNTPLHEERKQAIRSVFENWGLLEAPKEDAGTNSNPAG